MTLKSVFFIIFGDQFCWNLDLKDGKKQLIFTFNCPFLFFSCIYLVVHLSCVVYTHIFLIDFDF